MIVKRTTQLRVTDALLAIVSVLAFFVLMLGLFCKRVAQGMCCTPLLPEHKQQGDNERRKETYFQYGMHSFSGL